MLTLVIPPLVELLLSLTLVGVSELELELLLLTLVLVGVPELVLLELIVALLVDSATELELRLDSVALNVLLLELLLPISTSGSYSK